MYRKVCVDHFILQEKNISKSFVLPQSQKSVNSGNLRCKQILKAKLVVSPHAMTDKYASSSFAFQNNFSSNNTPFAHYTCHPPFCISALPYSQFP